MRLRLPHPAEAPGRKALRELLPRRARLAYTDPSAEEGAAARRSRRFPACWARFAWWRAEVSPRDGRAGSGVPQRSIRIMILSRAARSNGYPSPGSVGAKTNPFASVRNLSRM